MESGRRKGTFDSAAGVWMGFCSELHKGEKQRGAQSSLRSPLMTSRHDAVRPKNVYNVGSSSMTKCFEEKRGKKSPDTLCSGNELEQKKGVKGGGKGKAEGGKDLGVFSSQFLPFACS